MLATRKSLVLRTFLFLKKTLARDTSVCLSARACISGCVRGVEVDSRPLLPDFRVAGRLKIPTFCRPQIRQG